MHYTIRFENDSAFASAAAQRVEIRETLSENVNPFSFRLGDFGFGQYHFSVPNNASAYVDRIDLPDSLGFDLDVTAGLNIATNEVFWIFQSVDPATGLPPANPFLGFLVVNDSLGSGEGFVEYTIFPKTSAQTGDSIVAFADIVFDVNPPIVTPVWLNVVDALPPVTAVSGPSITTDTMITISWNGNDDLGGSGIARYEIYVSLDSGDFVLTASSVGDSTLNYPGTVGTTYQFFSVGIDNTGNREADKSGTPDLTVTISLSACATPGNPFTTYITPTFATLNWEEAPNIFQYKIRGRNVNSSFWKVIWLPPGTPTWKKVVGLQNNLTYVWQVQSVCDSSLTAFSEWSETDTFTTACTQPDSNWTWPVSFNGARLNWSNTAGSFGYQIRGRKIGQPWVNLNVGGGNTVSREVFGLESGAQYEWKVRTICDPGQTINSGYTGSTFFSTLSNSRVAGSTFQEPVISISPNPSNGRMTIQIGANEPGFLKMSLKDMPGRVVWKEERMEVSGHYEKQIDLRWLEPGLYIIEVNSLNGKYKEFVVIQ